jgi:hypothetical protein
MPVAGVSPGAQDLLGPGLVAAQECVQLHGGIGFTWEHPAHLYLKRAKADSIAFGTPDAHRTAPPWRPWSTSPAVIPAACVTGPSLRSSGKG